MKKYLDSSGLTTFWNIIKNKLTQLSTTISNHTSSSGIHITDTERQFWNTAYNNRHSHSNASVLNATTASYTTEEKIKLSNIAPNADVSYLFTNCQSSISSNKYDLEIIKSRRTYNAIKVNADIDIYIDLSNGYIEKNSLNMYDHYLLIENTASTAIDISFAYGGNANYTSGLICSATSIKLEGKSYIEIGFANANYPVLTFSQQMKLYT